MFGFLKKKQKEKQEILLHDEMGELKYFGGLWIGKIESVLFGEPYPMELFVYVDENDKYNFTLQNETFKYFINEQINLSKVISEELKDAYELASDFNVSDRFFPVTLFIFDGGESGISFRDKEYDEGCNAAHIVVTVTPRVECVGSEDDYA